MERSRRRLARHRLLTATIIVILLLSFVAGSGGWAQESTPAALDQAGSTAGAVAAGPDTNGDQTPPPVATDLPDNDSAPEETPLAVTTAPMPPPTAAPEGTRPAEPPTAAPTGTSISPTPAATSPAPTATATPIENRDTVHTDQAAGTSILRPGATAVYTLSYAVTTPRQETIVRVELRSPPGDLTGWRVRLVSLDGGDDWSAAASTAEQTETATTTPGSTLPLTFRSGTPAMCWSSQREP